MSEAAIPAPPPEGALAAFLRGLREPSVLALATTLVVAAALFLALTCGIDEEFMSSPRGRIFAMETNESPVYITSTLLRLRRGLPAEPQVYVFGPSSARSAVAAPLLETKLRAATGEGVTVISLAADSQRPIEALAMLDDLPAGARGIVVVGVGVPSLMYSAAYTRTLFEEPHMAVRLQTLEDEAARLGVATPPLWGSYFWDNRRFFLPRLPRAAANAFRGTRPYVPMQFLGRRPPTRGGLEMRMRRKWAPWVDREAADLARDGSLAVLGRLADAVAARGRMRLVLVEDTIHPGYRERPGVARVVDGCRAAISEFAARRGVPFLVLQDRAQIGADDFADPVHLRTPGAVARFTHELALELAPVMREIQAGER